MVKHRQQQQQEPVTGRLPELPLSPDGWERLPPGDAPEWFDGRMVDTGFDTIAVDGLYTDGKGHFLGRETAPPRWTMFAADGKLVRQDRYSYAGSPQMSWPTEFIALAITAEEAEQAATGPADEEVADAEFPEVGEDDGHFHPCVNCEQPCECGGMDAPRQGEDNIPECLGCGRKECPGNVDDPEVQGLNDEDEGTADEVEEALAAGEPHATQEEAPLVGATEQITLTEPLTQEQRAQAAKDLAEMQVKKVVMVAALKARKAEAREEWKEDQANIDALDSEMTKVAREVNDGRREIPLDCERRADLHSNEWYLVHPETGAEVPGHRRTMTASEIERLNPLPEPTVGQQQAAAIQEGIEHQAEQAEAPAEGSMNLVSEERRL